MFVGVCVGVSVFVGGGVFVFSKHVRCLTHGLIRVRCCVVQDNLGNFRGFALESER